MIYLHFMVIHENLTPFSWLCTALATLAIISEKTGLQSAKHQISPDHQKKVFGSGDPELPASWTDLQIYNNKTYCV